MKHCNGHMMTALRDQSIKPEMCRTVMNATMFDLPDWSIKLRMQPRRSYHVRCQSSANFVTCPGHVTKKNLLIPIPKISMCYSV